MLTPITIVGGLLWPAFSFTTYKLCDLWQLHHSGDHRPMKGEENAICHIVKQLKGDVIVQWLAECQLIFQNLGAC